MRVEPPTMTTWSMSDVVSPASEMADSKGPLVARDEICGQLVELGPRQLHVEVLGALGRGGDEGRLIWVSWTDDSSILAFSEASFRRCMAILSFERSTPRCP